MFQLGVVLGGTLLALIAFRISPWPGWLIVLLTLGAWFLAWHAQRAMKASLQRYTLWLRIKNSHLARMQLDWEQIPPVERQEETDHPFEKDLDISGPFSLHQLLNMAYSEGGRQRLRHWLLSTIPDPETMRRRQRLVRELTPLTRFRDTFQLASYRTILNVEQQNDHELLLLWLDLPLHAAPPFLILLISCLISACLCLFVGLYFFLSFSFSFVVAASLLAFLWFLLTGRYRVRLFEDASQMYNTLKHLTTVFTFLETYPYGPHQYVKDLCSPFQQSAQKPSTLVRRLRQIAQWARITQGGQVSARASTSSLTAGALEQQLWNLLFNIVIPLDLFLAFRLARWKDEARRALPQWLDIWYELECLCSLATFAYLNPEYVFPELLSSSHSSGVLLHAVGLGHPLLKDDDKVVNDVRIDEAARLLLITGSNMAGKSTFLRTLGINLVLAYAGGPVNAHVFQTQYVEVCCCIRVSDSLVEGYSYFYAELRRIKQILQRLQEGPDHPLFVLIDEIYKGTNNRERLVGSSAYLHALADAPCCGAISTHDLELAQVAEEVPHVSNVHFRDSIVDGEMFFDYRLRSGPCPTTNALKLMKMVGLPVTWKGASAH